MTRIFQQLRALFSKETPNTGQAEGSLPARSGIRKHGLGHIFSVFSANALQIAFSQLGGLVLFWAASKELSKNDFGDFNWYFAVYGTIAAFFSFGFDFIVIKRVSSRQETDAARMQLIQSLVVCAVSAIPVIALLGMGLFSEQFRATLFLLVAFQLTYLSMPFKNVLTGKELFAKSAQAVIISNSLKIALVVWMYAVQGVTLYHICLVLAVCNLVELLCYAVNSYQALERRFFGNPGMNYYFGLLKESMPQLGVIIFDSAFARIDWILLGALSTANAALNTAEYSFAYKIFELSKLPLLVLAPVLFTRFSKVFYHADAITDDLKNGVRSFFKLELVVGMTIPLILNLSWVPLMQFFTANKYGPENALIYFLLSLTLPIIYMINFLWTAAFAQNQLKLTMTLSIINSCLNILLNVLLIPKYGQVGAAVSFLACNVIMLPVYLYFVKQHVIRLPLKEALGIILVSVTTAVACYFLPGFFIVKTLICLVAYIVMMLSFKIVSFSDIKNLKHFISKN